jgi:hypothetical protein
LLLHLQKSIVTFLGQLVTSTTSVSFVVAGNYKAAVKDDIKIDTFLITDIIFQEN